MILSTMICELWLRPLALLALIGMRKRGVSSRCDVIGSRATDGCASLNKSD